MDYTKYELDRLKKKSPKEHAEILQNRKALRKQCGEEKRKSWNTKNPEKAKRCIRNSNYKKKYGITIQEYEHMFKQQGGVCAICNRPETLVTPSGETASLAVDHCHATGKVRKLLCRQCNTMLGGSRDNVDILLNAIKYLKEHHDDKRDL